MSIVNGGIVNNTQKEIFTKLCIRLIDINQLMLAHIFNDNEGCITFEFIQKEQRIEIVIDEIPEDSYTFRLHKIENQSIPEYQEITQYNNNVDKFIDESIDALIKYQFIEMCD